MRLCGAHGSWRNSACDAVFFLITNHQFNICHHATLCSKRQELIRFHVRTLTISDHHNAIHFLQVKCQRPFLPANQLCTCAIPSERNQGITTTGQVEGEFVLGSSKWTRILLNNKEAFVHSALVSRSRPSNSARPTATTAARTVSRAPAMSTQTRLRPVTTSSRRPVSTCVAVRAPAAMSLPASRAAQRSMCCSASPAIQSAAIRAGRR